MHKKVKIPGDYQYRALTKGPVVQRFWHENKLRLLDAIGKFSAGDVVLDAGCGSGNVSFYLFKKVKKIVGLDISNQAIDFAKKQSKKLRLINAVFQTADLRKMPFKNDSFSKIICFEVVEHMDEANYSKILKEFYRVLKPGGLIFLTTPNKLSPEPLIEWCLDRFKLVPSLSGQHVWRPTISKLKDIFTKNKFKVIKSGTINHFSPFLSLVSWNLAKMVFVFEVKYLKKFGPIIWLVAEK